MDYEADSHLTLKAIPETNGREYSRYGLNTGLSANPVTDSRYIQYDSTLHGVSVQRRHMHTHACIFNMYIHSYPCSSACMPLHMPKHTCKHPSILMSAHMSSCIWLHTCLYTCLHTCLHTCLCQHTCPHTCLTHMSITCRDKGADVCVGMCAETYM